LQTFERLSVGVKKIIEKADTVISHDTSRLFIASRSEIGATDIDLHQTRLGKAHLGQLRKCQTLYRIAANIAKLPGRRLDSIIRRG
jgi:hypothetical protein